MKSKLVLLIGIVCGFFVLFLLAFAAGFRLHNNDDLLIVGSGLLMFISSTFLLFDQGKKKGCSASVETSKKPIR